MNTSSSLNASRVPADDPFEDCFFDVDDILASQERVACVLETPLRGLGFLDSAHDTQDLAPGIKLELPFWLVKDLAGKRRVVTPELPKPYREGYRQILTADASVVDLNKLGPYYYDLGRKLCDLDVIREKDEIQRAMMEAYGVRFRTIMDASQNIMREDPSNWTKRLDITEKRLFAKGQRVTRELTDWEKRESQKIVASQTVINHKKRRMAEGNNNNSNS